MPLRPDLIVDLLPDGALSVKFPYDEFLVDFIRQVPGRRWQKEEKIWVVPSPALRDIKARAARLGVGVYLTERVQTAFALGVERRDALAAIKLDDRPLALETPTEAKPYQRAGIRYLQHALKNFKGALLADDMGCVAPETLIETEIGPLPIRLIVERRLQLRVWSYDTEGAGTWSLQPIVRWMYRPQRESFRALGQLRLTPDHRVWTREAGYVEAACLDPTIHSILSVRQYEGLLCSVSQGDSEHRSSADVFAQAPLFSLRGLQEAEEGLFSRPLLQLRGQVAAQESPWLHSEGAWPRDTGQAISYEARTDEGRGPLWASESRSRYAGHETAEARSLVCPDAGCGATESDAWRQRASLLATGGTGAGARLAERVSCGYEGVVALSDQLQDRRGRATVQDRYRSWQLCQQAEGTVVRGQWVDIPSLQQSTGRVGAGRVSSDGQVYNLTVAGNHNFVADGVLVANCGKTFQALALVARNDSLRRTLVLCPATLKYVWAGQIEEHFPQLTYTLVGGEPAERAAQWDAPTRLTIANYELLVPRHRSECPRSNAKKRRENRSTKSCLCGDNADVAARITDWDMVIADELTALKNYAAERTKRAKRLRRRYSLGLSGLPIENRLEELHSIMDFVVPGLLGPGWLFVQEHVVRDAWGKTLGYRGIEQIKERIAPYYLRRRKADVLTELPPKVYSDLPLEMSDAQWALYDAVRRQIIDEIEANPKLTADNILVLMLRLKQVTCDPRVLGDEAAGVKAEAFQGLLAEAGDHKVVAFTQFAEVARLWAADLSLPIIEGAVPVSERADIIKDFQAGRWPALISTGAGAYGITLTAADIVVHIDQEWNPAKMRQREDRLHRLGQHESVQVVTLMARRTIDERIRALLHRKWAVAAAIFDEADMETPPALTRGQLLALLGIGGEEE